MIDVTDRHCRYFHRLLARGRLYTEMITTGALLHGNVARHLDFDEAEHPVALQLGGSEPDALAQCARLGRQWGYDEINLNCGCPSERVQRGAFGACLMAEPDLVADCIKAMQDAVDIPVTVKHRLGLDYDDSYAFVRDFVGKIHDTGCRVFIAHARNAVLKGLSPKDNREIPPLRYDVVARLKRDFPDSVFVLNGGLADAAQSVGAAAEFDGVMLGRAAWHTPRVLSEVALALGPPAQRRPGGGRHDGLRRQAGGPGRAAARDDAPHARPGQRPDRRAPLASHAVRPDAVGRQQSRPDLRRLAHPNPGPEPPRRHARSRPGRHLNDAPATNKQKRPGTSPGV